MNIQTYNRHSKWYITYTEEMKALKTAYSQMNNIDQRTLYMFVMKKPKTDNETKSATIVGDMPRGKQFGFLFTEGTSQATLAKTIAHELGHGYFQLKHPFEMGLKQGDLKDNLMDYAGGTEFNKYQWDIMHDPGIVTGLFESDTSGMWASKLGHYIHQRANEEGVQWLYSNVINKINIVSQDTKVESLSINHIFQKSNDLLQQIENQNIDIKKRVKLLNEGTVFADEDQFQTGAYSYRHAMRNKNQNIDEAKNKADAFVREEYQKALNFKQQNLLDSAYFHLGIAIHVLQDATSPSHYGFKEWDDYPKLHPVVIIHALQEVSYPGFNSNLQQITNLYLELFENNKPLPTSNLFNNIQHD